MSGQFLDALQVSGAAMIFSVLHQIVRSVETSQYMMLKLKPSLGEYSTKNYMKLVPTR